MPKSIFKKMRKYKIIILIVIIVLFFVLFFLGFGMGPDKTWRPVTREQKTQSR